MVGNTYRCLLFDPRPVFQRLVETRAPSPRPSVQPPISRRPLLLLRCRSSHNARALSATTPSLVLFTTLDHLIPISTIQSNANIYGYMSLGCTSKASPSLPLFSIVHPGDCTRHHSVHEQIIYHLVTCFTTARCASEPHVMPH